MKAVGAFTEYDNGLAYSWKGLSVFVNGPYDNLMPWANKTWEPRAFVFLVNIDPSTAWWRQLLWQHADYRFEFDKRLQFDPPPRIKPSTNNKPSCLMCNREGALMVRDCLRDVGRWWIGQWAKPLDD